MGASNPLGDPHSLGTVAQTARATRTQRMQVVYAQPVVATLTGPVKMLTLHRQLLEEPPPLLRGQLLQVHGATSLPQAAGGQKVAVHGIQEGRKSM